MTKEQAQEKISKLLKLSGSPNQNEAFAALAKAQEIAMKFGLGMKQIDTEKVSDKKRDSGYSTLPKWYRDLMSVIAYNFNCKLVDLCSGGQFAFIGMESDVEIAEKSAHFAVNSLKQLWRIFLKKYKAGLRFKRGKRYQKHINQAKNSYFTGFIVGLQRRYAQNVEKYGLVLATPEAVVEYCKEKYSPVQHRKPRKTKVNDEAFVQGYKDGIASRTENMHTMIGG